MAALVHPCGDQRRQRTHRPFVLIVSHLYDLRVSHPYASEALTSGHTGMLSHNVTNAASRDGSTVRRCSSQTGGSHR
jgi:hypothetical protein